MTKKTFIIAKSINKNIWFYEGRSMMANELHKGVKIYKTRHGAEKTLRKLHIYDEGWIIVTVSI